MAQQLTVAKLRAAMQMLARDETVPTTPTYLPKALYDRAEAEGYDMSRFAVLPEPNRPCPR